MDSSVLLILVLSLVLALGATGIMLYSVAAAARREALVSRERRFYENEIVERVERLLASRERWEDVNHLLIDGQRLQSDALQVFSPSQIPMLVDLGLDKLDLSIDPELVFVLAPVRPETDVIYRLITRIAGESNLRTNRADIQQSPGGVLKQVVQNIAIARLIIADVSTRNPNVYYELGIAHALGKPAILISKNVGEVGFDIAADRLIIFEHNYQLEEKLRRAIAEVLVGRTYTSGR